MRERLARDISPVAADRAEHFFAEDERVERMAAALLEGDMPEYIRNMNASGASSRTLLRNVVPALHPERTEMAAALDRAAALLEGKGASSVLSRYPAMKVSAPRWTAITARVHASSCA